MKVVGHWTWIGVMVGLASAGCTHRGPDAGVERRQAAVLFEQVSVPAGTNVQVDLQGGLAAVNGVSLLFFSVAAPFSVSVIDSQRTTGATPPGAFKVSDTRFWHVAASQPVGSTFEICLHYDETEISGFGGEELLMLLRQISPGGAEILTTQLDTNQNVICGVSDVLPVASAPGTLAGQVRFRGLDVTGLDAQPLKVSLDGVAVSFDPALGTYSQAGVPIGEHTLRVTQPGCAGDQTLLQTNVTVDASGTTSADLDLTPNVGRLTGLVVGSGIPIPRPLVRLPATCTRLPSDVTGRFDGYALPGTHTVEIGLGLAFVSIEVSAGQVSGSSASATPAGSPVHVDLLGGLASPGGVSLDFTTVTAPGLTAASQAGPASGVLSIAPGAFGLALDDQVFTQWRLGTTAHYSGSVSACFHYQELGLPPASEAQLRIYHDDGLGIVNVTSIRDPDANVICAFFFALPSGIPLGAAFDVGPDTPPEITVPEEIQVQTMGPTGIVTYTASAQDRQEGPVPVSCEPPSGSVIFADITLGLCQATDSAGLTGQNDFVIRLLRPPVLSPLGDACADGTTCASGFCVDGVCCDGACGGGAAGDCQACFFGAGNGNNGTCGSPVGQVCRSAAGACDVAEACIVGLLVCPADGFAAQDTPCATAGNICQLPGVCSGTGPACPGTTPIAGCSTSPVTPCAQMTCPEIEVLGGAGPANQISLNVQGGITLASGATSGQASARPCGSIPPVTAGYKIVENNLDLACWDLEFSPDVQATANPDFPIIVCITAPNVIVAGGGPFFLYHDEGGGFIDRTISVDHGTGKICASVTSLSPFAIVTLADKTPPAVTGLPASPLVAYATSTAGAKVTFPAPAAVDAVDGPVPVSCSRQSGTTFAPGKTTVTCTATDRTGNAATASFTVWVQYQAPADGSFFLLPVRANGSSIFRVGRPVPVRFKLTGASAGITNLAAKLTATKISNAVQGTVEDTSDETQADTDFVFKYRPVFKWYAYRWKTSDQTQGTYRLTADLGDGVPHVVTVSLKAAR
jgi:hypothetical protein